MRGEGDKKRWQGWNYSAHPQNKEPILTLVSPPNRFLFLFFFISYFFRNIFSRWNYSTHPQNKESILTLESQQKNIVSKQRYCLNKEIFVNFQIIWRHCRDAIILHLNSGIADAEVENKIFFQYLSLGWSFNFLPGLS